MPELRKDPITARWVIMATERGKRPSDFVPETEEEESDEAIKHCPFCEGNEAMTPPEITAIRAPGTQKDTPGWKVRVTANKFPALRIEGDLGRRGIGMYDLMNGVGAHEVVIESPDHKKRLGHLPVGQIADIFKVCRSRVEDLMKDRRFDYMLIFKNQGKSAGASLNHAHTQIIATPIVPKRVLEEIDGAISHYQAKRRCIFCDIIDQEQMLATHRIIYTNDEIIAISPFAARFPFEVWILPKKHLADFTMASDHNLQGFAEALKVVLLKLTKALNRPDYNHIIHTIPNRLNFNGSNPYIEEGYHWHMEIIPRLTKLAGFEWGSGFYINPTLPEVAADYLRDTDITGEE